MDDAYSDEKSYSKLESAIKKAVDPHETPIKQKHIRSAIIGTFQPEAGARVFWSLAIRHPAHGDRVVAWKLCHVVHKVLREGHPLSLVHSQRHRDYLDNVGKMWAHLERDVYGKLIRLYTRLLMVKLRFHAKNGRFPGHLGVNGDELDQICTNDPNASFELTVDMFDYLDTILDLQAAIFGSLDTSRFSSMTVAGQCRLGPLIPCIQDAARLYDSAVKILYTLHVKLSPEFLIGHRERFLKQFRLLRRFFRDTAALQYFKDLISVPVLPDHPPDFLVRASRKAYVTQEVKVRVEPEEVPPPVVVAPLVDTSTSNNTSSTNGDGDNTKVIAAITAERDAIILKLRLETDQLRSEITTLHQHVQLESRRMREHIVTLESDLAARDAELCHERQQLDTTESQLAAAQQELTALAVAVTQDKADKDSSEVYAQQQRARDEKFGKLKEVYTKLREEHIALIRAKAEVEKRVLRGEREREEELGRWEVDRREVEGQLKVLQEYVESESLARLDKDAHTLREAELMIRRGREELDNPALAAVTCTADYLRTLGVRVEECIVDLVAAGSSVNGDAGSDGGDSVTLAAAQLRLGHALAGYLVYARATCNGDIALLAPEEMIECCRHTADTAITTLRDPTDPGPLRSNLASIARLADGIDSGLVTAVEDLGTALEDELTRMDRAVEEAAARIAEMLSTKGREGGGVTGLQLEVNGKILDACTGLMEAIRELVRGARELQGEIVQQGKDPTTSAKDFYKRNHRWTDGFISAAKSVAAAATFLLGAADRAVTGEGKLAQVAVAAQEIAACTAQLVVASRVKADRHSQRLQKVTGAAKSVSLATGAVVATSKACAQLMEDAANELDVSGLGLHAAKQLEMEAQVRVLELEAELEAERRRLSALRRQHYQLAGE